MAILLLQSNNYIDKGIINVCYSFIIGREKLCLVINLSIFYDLNVGLLLIWKGLSDFNQNINSHLDIQQILLSYFKLIIFTESLRLHWLIRTIAY